MIQKRKWTVVFAILLIIIASSVVLWVKQNNTNNNQPQEESIIPETITDVKKTYDVIVAGTDPEGVTAAVSAARNGLNVLLVDGKEREILGGLITVGWLNTLDLNYSPVKPDVAWKHNFLNKGLFQEWYDKVEGTSVDTNTAALVFNQMVKNEPNIEVLMKVKSMKPIIETVNDVSSITGLTIVKEDGVEIIVQAKAVIDATQDGDIAAEAGVPFTTGREDLGNPEARMAVTLVFKLSGVTQEVWDSFNKRDDGTGTDKMSAWGFKDAKDYVSSNPERVGLRGLNIGRENDDTILINAMHIFGIDPLNPESIEEAFEIGQKEAPLITAYLKEKFPELKDLKLVGTAPELYVRETRHIQGEYRLTATDLLENRDQWDAIAYGSYAVDIQRLSNNDNGAIVMSPEQYGVPFRTIVPLKVDNLLVVGRAASFDTIPHGSARVIPLGMATAQAAGAAAKLSIDQNISFRELSKSKGNIEALRAMLVEQGMDLTMNKIEPTEYSKHKAYKGLLAAVSMGVAFGGYDNSKFDLDLISNPTRFVRNMKGVSQVHASFFPGSLDQALNNVSEPLGPLSLQQAALIICTSAGIHTTLENAVSELQTKGWVKEAALSMISDPEKLTDGDTYMLIRDVVEYHVGVVYK